MHLSPDDFLKAIADRGFTQSLPGLFTHPKRPNPVSLNYTAQTKDELDAILNDLVGPPEAPAKKPAKE